MTEFNRSAHSGKKMAIITSFFKDETYGLLGPQLAATIIQDHTSYECIVIAVTREHDNTALKNTLSAGSRRWQKDTF